MMAITKKRLRNNPEYKPIELPPPFEIDEGENEDTALNRFIRSNIEYEIRAQEKRLRRSTFVPRTQRDREIASWVK